jgi:hypothetical protein
MFSPASLILFVVVAISLVAIFRGERRRRARGQPSDIPPPLLRLYGLLAVVLALVFVFVVWAYH